MISTKMWMSWALLRLIPNLRNFCWITWAKLQWLQQGTRILKKYIEISFIKKLQFFSTSFQWTKNFLSALIFISLKIVSLTLIFVDKYYSFISDLLNALFGITSLRNLSRKSAKTSLRFVLWAFRLSNRVILNNSVLLTAHDGCGTSGLNWEDVLSSVLNRQKLDPLYYHGVSVFSQFLAHLTWFGAILFLYYFVVYYSLQQFVKWSLLAVAESLSIANYS